MLKVIANSESNFSKMQSLKKLQSLTKWDKKSIFQKFCILFVFSLAGVPAKSMAQIIPDESLPTTVQQLQEIMRINGGERAGDNLFHSFEEFSVGEGIEAVFDNAVDIENIFTRITGDTASDINGILRTQGGANFFLLNPNGIIFGTNAQLDVGGSFVGTTADSIQFEGNTEFAANDSAGQSLISIERPIGLNFSGNSGGIVVNGNGNQITPDFSSSPTSVETANTVSGLSIASEETLALIGGDINVSGGMLNANDGRIEIGSVGSGLVNFQKSENGFSFDFEDVTNYQNVALDNLSVIDASGSGEGDIFLNAANVDLQNGSLILIQNQGNIPSGSIDINVSDSLTLSGTSPDGNVSSVIRSEAINSGKSADINISTTQLVLQNGARIGSTTFSNGLAGDVSITSANSIQLLENTLINQNRQGFTVSGISSVSPSSGNAGNVRLTTSNLDITSGASVQSSASRTGNGGNLTIVADRVNISGINPNSERSTPSALAASVNSGNAGNLSIDTSQLKITDGGVVSSSTFGNGNAGDINIFASESIELNGETNNLVSSIRSRVAALTSEATRERIGSPEVPGGRGGSVEIITPLLNVTQRGIVSVNNEGTGDSGNIFINADQLNLEEVGSIEASTLSGQGGNIQLDTESLRIVSDSSITATADNNGNGGNVSINTTGLLAKKNSNIAANAFAGTGGNIQIETRGLFLFPNSTIDASSELGVDGTVVINTLDTNLQRDLELSEFNLIVSEDSLANSCLARRNSTQGSFVVDNGTNISDVTGNKFYESSSLTGINNFDSERAEQLPKIEPQTLDNVVPAQQAVKTVDGRVFLVAASKPQSSKSLVCN